MAIRFPRMHIATSVQNRILNAADNIAAAYEELPAPDIPDARKAGQAIDQALSQPVPAIPAPEDSSEAVVTGSVQGETAADAVGGLAAIEAMTQ